MTVEETKPVLEEPVVEPIPSPEEDANDADDDNNDESTDGTPKKKKTRRSRRGGYRRKRQQQKKVAALMAEAAAKRALAKAATEAEDSSSTATTEEESSSCESTSSNKIPQRACARKKSTVPQPQCPQQQPTQMLPQQHYHQQQSYYQGPMHPQMYPAYGYGYPGAARQFRSKKWKKSRFLTQSETSLYVALDCEMVGVGEYGKHSALARVTLVNWDGQTIMDELVKPQWKVTDYRTFVSGITPEMLDNATMDFATARRMVLNLLHGKILVGHGLTNDLAVLGITHPWHAIRDTAKYEPFMKVRFQDGCLWPRGLKDLAAEKLGKAIQVYGRSHCPKEDATAALDLYKLVWRQWEKSIEYKMSRNWAAMPQPQMVPAM